MFQNAALGRIVSALPGLELEQQKAGGLPQETPSNNIHVVKGIEIPARSQAEVWVRSAPSGLAFLQGNPCLNLMQHSMVANGAMEMAPKIPFRVVISNLKESSLQLHKGNVVGIALPVPPGLAYPRKREEIEMSDTVAALEPEVELEGLQEKKDLPTPWQDKLQIGKDFEEYRPRIVELLSAFEDMWNGRLGHVNLSKHRIQWTPETNQHTSPQVEQFLTPAISSVRRSK